MTFTEIVSTIMNRLNLTSTEAQTRIGVLVNERYKRVTSSIGLITSRRTYTTLTVDPTDTATYPDLPKLTIGFMEKVLKVALITNDASSSPKVLPQSTYDQLSSMPTLDALPRVWAPVRMGAGQVLIMLDAVPASTTFNLNIEGYDIAETLEDDVVPFIPTDFHDILIEGVMADELNKMEKPQLAIMREQMYSERLSDLRMFIAKSAWLDLYQGKTKPKSSWYWPWMTRVSNLGIE